jgi:transcriptional regulator with XRE-family HTH domain
VPVPFAGVLRGLRRELGLTQEELAEAAGLSSRAIAYLERDMVSSPQKETVRLLADALRLAGPARARFETTARGRRRAGRNRNRRGCGRCALAVGHIAEGGASLRQALAIFQRIGSARAADVPAELDALSG